MLLGIKDITASRVADSSNTDKCIVTTQRMGRVAQSV